MVTTLPRPRRLKSGAIGKSPGSRILPRDLLATSYRAQVACGLITDAGVRDAGLGECTGDLCGRISQPGDVVLADDDGVVVVPRDVAAQVADAAEAREANEGDKRARLAAGVLGLDMYNMRGPLEKAGLKYLD